MVINFVTFPDIDVICRSIGFIGVLLYVGGFFCLCVGRLDSRGTAYFGLVFVAASCVLVSLWADFNLSAAMIQLFYIAMSLGGVVMRGLARPRFAHAPTGADRV